jgi:hypothetical protein
MIFEQAVKEINHEVIKTKFENLTIENIKPAINLTARARANYLKELFDVANEFPDSLPPVDRVERLKNHRVRYEELIFASKALETAIQRKYLNVQP